MESGFFVAVDVDHVVAFAPPSACAVVDGEVDANVMALPNGIGEDVVVPALAWECLAELRVEPQRGLRRRGEFLVVDIVVKRGAGYGAVVGDGDFGRGGEWHAPKTVEAGFRTDLDERGVLVDAVVAESEKVADGGVVL